MKKFLLISILCIPLIFLYSCSFFSSPDNKKSASPQTDFSKSINLDRRSVKLALNKSVTVDAKLNIPKQLSSFKMNKVNIPVRQRGYGDGYDGTGVEDTVLEVYYNKNGWVTFDERWGYIFEETKEKQDILTVNDALNSLKHKYDLITSPESYTFTEMNLELAPVFIKDNNYEIRPVWSFKGQTSSSSSETEVLFDGTTGKELIQ